VLEQWLHTEPVVAARTSRREPFHEPKPGTFRYESV